MKTKELIRRLQIEDPVGETEVCVDNVDILFVSGEPAYHDGPAQVLIRDESNPYYNVIGAKYLRSGSKIVIHTHSISDAITDNSDLPVDYSQLSPVQAENTRRHHDATRQFMKDLEYQHQLENFIRWVEAKVSSQTVDTEDLKARARYFFELRTPEQQKPKYPDGLPTVGTSFYTRQQYCWDQMFEVVFEHGFWSIKFKGESNELASG